MVAQSATPTAAEPATATPFCPLAPAMPAAIGTATPVRRAASARLAAPATPTLDLAVSDCANAAEPDSASAWVLFNAVIDASPPILMTMPAALT
ncbi:hypothetical protein G6F65_022742 [Rhizopus arrhizus]|nr:hypothetical protein G6F65_022742 [Rhizopus arrhizus]